MVVAEGAALGRAAAGAGDVVPAGRQRLAGGAGAGVDEGHEQARAAQPVGQLEPRQVIGGSVVDGGRQAAGSER